MSELQQAKHNHSHNESKQDRTPDSKAGHKSTDYKAIAKRTMWTYFFSYLILPVAFVTKAIYARNVNIVDYGLFFGLFAFFGLFSFLRDWGLQGSATFYANKYLVKGEQEKVKTLYWLTQMLQIASALVIIIILFVFRELIFTLVFKNEGHIAFIFNLFAIYWVFDTIFQANMAFLNIFQEQHISKALDFMGKVFILIASLASLKLIETYKIPIIAYLAAQILIAMISSYFLFRRHGAIFRTKAYRGHDLLSEYVTYAGFVALGSVAALIYIYTDTVLVQIYLGAAQVGYYTSAVAIGQFLMVFVNPVLLIVWPLFAKLWHEGRKDELSKIASFAINHLPLVIIPFAFFFIVFADRIVYVALGPAFASSVPILNIFAITVIFISYTSVTAQVIIAMGRPRALSKLTFIMGALNLALCLALIPFLQTIGAAIATLVANIFYHIFILREIRKTTPLPINLKTLIKIIVSAAVFAAVAFFLKTRINVISIGHLHWSYFANGVLVFIIAGTVYAGLLFAFGVVTKEKIMYVKKLFARGKA